jgi:phosphopantetheinyl transferase
MRCNNAEIDEPLSSRLHFVLRLTIFLINVLILTVFLTSNWLTAPKKLVLPEVGAVHVWRISGHSNTNPSTLSAQEIASCNKLTDEKANNYQHNRSGMREILSRYSQQQASDINFTYNTSGKPSLLQPFQHIVFNLSHCTDMTLLAVSQQEIGIDVEPIQNRHNIAAIAQRMFNVEIANEIKQLSGAEQNKCFATYWTQFEARIKARGGSIFDQKKDLSPTLSIEIDNKWMCSLAFHASSKQPHISHCYQL